MLEITTKDGRPLGTLDEETGELVMTEEWQRRLRKGRRTKKELADEPVGNPPHDA